MEDKELIEKVKEIANKYPENSIDRAILLQIVNRFIGQQVQIDETKCLHCGKNIAGYCEKCYQELIGENAKLQLENKNIRKFNVHIEGMRSGKQLLKKYVEDSILKDEIREKIEEDRKWLSNNQHSYYASQGEHNDYIVRQIRLEVYKELLEEEQ